MNSVIPPRSMAIHNGWFFFGLLVLAGLLCDTAWAQCNNAPGCKCQDIAINPKDIPTQCPGNLRSVIYDNAGGTPIADAITLCPAPDATTTTVDWSFSAGLGAQPGGPCTATSTDITCDDKPPTGPAVNTMVLKAPPPPGLGSAQFSGTVPGGPVPNFDFKIFTVTATDHNNAAASCAKTYNFNTMGTSGGWGDPHITTVDGVHYDFQGAGEFISLRSDRQGGGESAAPRSDGLEIQTRQTGIATTFLPGANGYTGLQTCVALYSAVAARVGKHRVSYEPNLSGVPDPSGLQLRVDGVLTTLAPQGIDLDGSRIVPPWGGAGIEIDFSDKTILIVTPAFWPDQQKWYLNVNVYAATATAGIFGKLAAGSPPYYPASWLPALPDGTSLGPKPDSLHQRYLDLYGKFADAWRVTDATSLFDYAPGTSTATFTDRGWPRENPQSCAVEGQPSAGPPVDVGVAETACSAVVDNNMRADCVFDVSVTGFTGFANTYVLAQQRRPDATETTVKGDRDFTTYGENATFTATVAQTVSRGAGAPTGTAQFTLDGGKVGTPVMLDANGRALWSSSGLQVGQHQIVAQYIPTGWGPFMASTSPQVSHTVIAAGYHLYFWLIILLLIITLILIAFLIWRSLRRI